MRFDLNGEWLMTDALGEKTTGRIPGSVYSFLLDAGKMEDPYYRDNELTSLKLMDQDYTFSRTFEAGEEICGSDHVILRFDGVDTIADIFLNGTFLGHTDNMHMYWEYDVKEILHPGENELRVELKSPTKFIAQADAEYHLGGSTDAMVGFPHLRKAHCMFGWDWGPRLPDMGIWKDVYLFAWNTARIEDIHIRQKHFLSDGTAAMGAAAHCSEAKDGKIQVEVCVNVTTSAQTPVQISLESPDGEVWNLENHVSFRVPSPKLWWPNGLGEQPLYTVRVCIDGEEQEKRIGLRTVTMKREPDQWGETFAMTVNGLSFFSMGADYIPEDNILSRLSKERTEKLLDTCTEAHFNVIRVWGGGFYPMDYFYDLCDEKGFLIWQDMMFACANYRITPDYVASIQEEIRQNVTRLRHHASAGLWCGNNEMEEFAVVKAYDGNEITAADYLIQTEYIIPEVIRKADPDGYYWPSSPCSGGKFVNPVDPNRGDVHYWDVWHAGVPFTSYRDYHFRYLSEFGFQSFPGLETVKSFTEEEDRNIFSYVMEMHQRNSGANGKIMYYLSATYQYPGDFETLLYASQLLQAEAIRYGVEHFRRNRNDDRCMGAVYWQLNDIWPVASWASVDYFYRWKALHYFAKRFFSPVMISCEEVSEVSRGRTCVSQPAPAVSTAKLNVTNETWETVKDTVEWALCDPTGKVLESGSIPVEVAPFSSLWLDQLDFSSYDYRSIHLIYCLKESGSFGSVLFCAPKHYKFADPQLSVHVDEAAGTVTVESQAFAKAVEVYSPNGYIRFDDNYFDMEKGTRTLKVLEAETDLKDLKVRSVYNIR